MEIKYLISNNYKQYLIEDTIVMEGSNDFPQISGYNEITYYLFSWISIGTNEAVLNEIIDHNSTKKC